MTHIHLWFAFLDEFRDEHVLEQCRQILPEEERRQEKRFYFERDQHRYLVTRYLVRTVLSWHAPITPAQWSFSANGYGKPEIANEDPMAKKISFNISHTSGLIVLGVTCDNALGVDTENIQSRQAPLEIGGHFFSSVEAAALDQLPEEEQPDRFFRYWTLKESYIKARGMGLSIPLDQFEFEFPKGNLISLATNPQLNDPPSRWNFWQFRPTPEFLVAVCVERQAGVTQCLILKKFAPENMEEELSCYDFFESIVYK